MLDLSLEAISQPAELLVEVSHRVLELRLGGLKEAWLDQR
jgi:hypothetical protein